LAASAAAIKMPGVLVVPTWLSVTDSIRHRADQLADLGYTVFVADVFGEGVRPKPPQSPLDVIRPFLEDRKFFRERLLAGLEALHTRPECSRTHVAAIGYCLGGCGVLELARSGADLKGVVSLHGVLHSPLPAKPGAIKAKVLVLHGDDDPVAPIEQVIAFRNEMRSAGANWEINIYSNARHSFTGEGVFGEPTPEAGLHSQSDARSWRTLVTFLHEVLSNGN
jgi:dienelactone hydrolase